MICINSETPPQKKKKAGSKVEYAVEEKETAKESEHTTESNCRPLPWKTRLQC